MKCGILTAMISVIILSVSMLSVIMLSVIMLSVMMLSVVCNVHVIMLRVMAPKKVIFT